MATRFAGSQRLGDRRRRRLAVESDEPTDQETTGDELPSAAGAQRTVHTPARASQAEVALLPMTGLVPAQWWKYLLGGLTGLVTGGSVVAAGWYESIGSTVTGAGFTRLFALPDGPVAAWYAGLLLNLSAQLAALIWWGRSRSHKDFDGRYRLWTRTAGVWLLFSFCAVTGAHRAFSETVLHFVPQRFWGMETLVWLAPASLLGATLLLTLNREMSDCRASRVFLFLAAACYVAAGGLRLPIEIPLTDRWHALALVGSALLGHLCLFLSMWLHARHVLHFTADPSRPTRRRLRIPRPHFRLPRIGFGRKGIESATSEPEEVAAPVRERKRRARKATGSTKRHDEEVDEAETCAPEPSDVAEQVPHDEHEPLTLPPRREAPRTAPAPIPEPQPEPPQREADRGEPTDESEDAWTESFPKPDMRGMSKKQRRRLMQEMREKERASRRG